MLALTKWLCRARMSTNLPAIGDEHASTFPKIEVDLFPHRPIFDSLSERRWPSRKRTYWAPNTIVVVITSFPDFSDSVALSTVQFGFHGIDAISDTLTIIVSLQCIDKGNQDYVRCMHKATRVDVRKYISARFCRHCRLCRGSTGGAHKPGAKTKIHARALSQPLFIPSLFPSCQR